MMLQENRVTILTLGFYEQQVKLFHSFMLSTSYPNYQRTIRT